MAAPAPQLVPDDSDPTFAELIAGRPHLSVHAHDGLTMEEVPLARIAAAVGTPTWVYSAGTLRRRFHALRGALDDARVPAELHFAVKANPNLAVVRTLAKEGAGADIVSEGELRLALAAGIDPSHVVFSGVGKTLGELRFALSHRIGQINAESAEEIGMISAVATEMGVVADVALRVNPDVDARTHAKITTGKSENKFGVAIADAPALYARMAATPGVNPVGIAVHIGSQITSGVSAYAAAYAALADLVRALREQGLSVERVDCGGGLGIPYRHEPAPSPAALAGAIRGALGNLGVKLMVEPGRWICGPAGVLLTQVILQKHTPSLSGSAGGSLSGSAEGSLSGSAGGSRRFVILDAAMNDLLRPAMYDAWHGIVPVGPREFVSPVSPCDVVGPVCETGDTFARNRGLPMLEPGSLVAFLDAGAYGASMSSTYNARPLAAEVLVDGDRFAVVRARQTQEALLAGQRLPEWLAG
ncbi:diaminopimelate decarboxylase [Falsiroseomonas oryziterrae]|uniref:diaminopimelate decarboxylase n=1 Tax=Falsiroseomonas oryziterrae TaxID=2911368 RepID=UPI001F018F98|nr:diaminopimelate decarboxylase [Roseomonas sp. NPKOSM-4]